jgi:uncharacterized protein DUF2505
MRAMAEARIEHIFNCSEDTFWNKVFFDADYNKRLFREELAFPRWEEVSKEDKGDQIRRVIEIVPKMADLPGPLKKLAGDGVSYREEGIFDKKTRRYKVTIHPNRLSDKLFIKGELFTEPAGDNKCKRIYLASVEAKVFGVGGMLEKRVISDIQAGYDAGARFTNKYLAEKGL